MQLIHTFQSLYLLLVCILIIFIFVGCSQIAISTHDIKDTQALQSAPPPKFDPLETNIAKPYQKQLIDKPKLTGAILVSDGIEAFLHRAALAKMAQKSILLQTYIYKNDRASRLLMHEIWLAAERGVQVKMLIDDNGLDSDFSDIIALNSHPNIEVKIFNPYKHRSRLLRYSEMVFDFSRINRRMHNKIFVVDDIALIIGGRNIADNYFDQDYDVNFVDTDVLFIGDVAKNGVQSFYEYWHFHRSIPVALLPFKTPLKKLRDSVEQIIEDNNTDYKRYESAISALIDKYQNKGLEIHWGNATLIADKPEKIENLSTTKPITKSLGDILHSTKNNIYIAAAYLVPSDWGMKTFKTLLEKNVKIYILTNSLASTDLLVVYGAWERYRDTLIKIGAQVYEYQYLGDGKSRLRDKTKKSKASLHSKSIVFDDSIAWIGSFNLDQRSNEINTEVVVVFDNPHFAKMLKDEIIGDMRSAWKLDIKNHKTVWIGEYNGKQVELKTSPDTGIWTRFLKTLSKILPETQI